MFGFGAKEKSKRALRLTKIRAYLLVKSIKSKLKEQEKRIKKGLGR